MRRPLLIVAVLACAAPLAILLSAAGSDDRDRIGLSTHLQLSDEPVGAQLARLRELGIRWIREDFDWSVIEKEPGRFDWSGSDELMAAAAQNGLEVVAILTYSPSWASSDAAGGKYAPPRDLGAFARFARRVVDRYGERGLAAVELWNEPWGHYFWGPEPDPKAYAELARRTAAEVRSADSDVAVLVPADVLQVRTDGAVRPWFEELLQAAPRLPALVDAWTVHPYPNPRDRSPQSDDGDPRFQVRRVTLTRDVARRHNAEREIWITEIGWSSAAEAEEAVTEQEQASYVAGTLDLALGEWRDFVARTFIFSWDRSREDPGDREGGYGLRRADGSLKPAWGEIAERLP